jgi:hypothetical protein
MHPAGHAVSKKQSQTQGRPSSCGQGQRVTAQLLVICNQILIGRTQPDLRRFF